MAKPKKTKPVEKKVLPEEVSQEEPRLKPEVKEEGTSPESTTEEPRLKAPDQELPAGEDEEDYLRKYQVRGDTQPGSLQSDPPPGSKAEVMKKFLLSQRRIRMLVPRIAGQDKSVPQTVTRNNYRLDFPANTYVEVPEAIADQLRESFGQTEAALEHNRIDGNSSKENALL